MSGYAVAMSMMALALVATVIWALGSFETEAEHKQTEPPQELADLAVTLDEPAD